MSRSNDKGRDEYYIRFVPEEFSIRDGKNALMLYSLSVVGSLFLIGGLAVVSVI